MMDEIRQDLAGIIGEAASLLALDQAQPPPLDQVVALCNKMSTFAASHQPRTCPLTGQPTSRLTDVEGIRMGHETALRYLSDDEEIVALVRRGDRKQAAPLPSATEDQAIEEAIARQGKEEPPEYGHLGPEEPAAAEWEDEGDLSMSIEQAVLEFEKSKDPDVVRQAVISDISSKAGWDPEDTELFIERFTDHWRALSMNIDNEDWREERQAELKALDTGRGLSFHEHYMLEGLQEDLSTGALPSSLGSQAEQAVRLLTGLYLSLE